MRFWALASSLLLTAVLQAQSFGRFGYSELPPIPGFRFDKTGFRVADSPSDTFRFAEPITALRPVSISDRVAEYVVEGSSGMEFARVDLRKPGFELYFREPLNLKLSSLQNPLLSFEGGTFGPGIPTPAVKWVVITFMDQQPPVFLNFTGDPQGVTCEGSAGNWTIKTSGSPGWVRICAPRGIQPFSGERIDELGRLVGEVAQHLPALEGQPPQLVSFRTQREGARLVVEWVFDRPGVWVPPALLWAKEAGYELRIESPIANAESDTAAGPLYYCTTPRLVVNFPCAKPVAGRPVLLGLQGQVAPFENPGDYISAARNGWPYYSAQSREGDIAQAGAFSQTFFNTVKLHDAAAAGQQHPVDAAGNGADLLAAHALNLAWLGPSAVENPALTSLLWRRDWLACGTWGESRTALTRADSLLALACWVTGEESRLVDGCMLWAGLMAEISRPMYMQRIGLNYEAPAMVVAWPDLLKGIYHRPGSFPDLPALSPLRVLSSERLFLQRRDGRLVLSWNAATPGEQSILFWSAKPLNLRPLANLGGITATARENLYRVNALVTRPGLCEAILEWPDSWPAIPEPAPAPAYREAPLSKSIL